MLPIASNAGNKDNKYTFRRKISTKTEMAPTPFQAREHRRERRWTKSRDKRGVGKGMTDTSSGVLNLIVKFFFL